MGHMTIEVRAASEPVAMTNAIREGERMFAWLASLFGLLALLLASVELYGVIEYSTMRRTAEIGVRMALGAHRRDVMAMVLREALRLTAIGVVIGLALAPAVGRVVSSMLYGVSAADPLTILGASVLMFVAAMWTFFDSDPYGAWLDVMITGLFVIAIAIPALCWLIGMARF